MANSPSIIRQIRLVIHDSDDGRWGQGVIDVYAFVECPDFPLAHGWHRATCPADIPVVRWLEANLGDHLNWDMGGPPA